MKMQESNNLCLGYVQDSGLIKDGDLFYNDALNRQYFEIGRASCRERV